MFLQHRISYLAIGVVAIVFLAGILFFNYEKKDAPKAEAAGFVPVVANVMGFAWSSNIGWISFNNQNCDTNNDGFSEKPFLGCPNVSDFIQGYGVNLDASDNLSGYAWSSNIGWINFDLSDIQDNPPKRCPTSNVKKDCQAHLNGTNFFGWARACSVFVSSCTGALKPASGWDGWIKLGKDSSDPPLSPAYGVSLSGNDFTGFAWGSDVVGWLSFNCNTGTCTASNNYRVYIASAASAQSLKAFKPSNYCIQPPSFSLEWKYKNSSGLHQAQYNIQVATVADFSSLIVDVTNLQDIDPLNINPVGTTGLRIVPVLLKPLDINYGKNYYWRLRVQDTSGSWSDWIEYNDPLATFATDGDANPKTFTTDSHMWPTVDFSPPSPTITSFLVNSTVDFTDSSTCYGGPCSNLDWDFCGEGTSLALQSEGNCLGAKRTAIGSTVSHVYDFEGAYDIVHTVTDSDSNKCSVVKTLGAVRTKWKEIVPY